MPEETPTEPKKPILDFNNPKAAGILLLLGAPILRFIGYLEDVDFILSIREERMAMTLQLFFDWGWLVLIFVALAWILSVREPKLDTTRVHWGMVTSVGILAFIGGMIITIHAIGSAPNVLVGWGGDPISRACSAMIDTSHLLGLKSKDRIILLCGVSDPTRDPSDDERIAISQPFNITGQTTTIVAPYGAMAVILRDVPEKAAFALWHSVAVIPKDLDVSEIKRVSDITKRGGQMLTEPPAGAYQSVTGVMPVTQQPCPPVQTPTPVKPKIKQN